MRPQKYEDQNEKFNKNLHFHLKKGRTAVICNKGTQWSIRQIFFVEIYFSKEYYGSAVGLDRLSEMLCILNSGNAS